MKKLKTRKWKDEVNALMHSYHIKRIQKMSLDYLRDILAEAMNIGYGFQQEENLTKHNNDFKKVCQIHGKFKGSVCTKCIIKPISKS